MSLLEFIITVYVLVDDCLEEMFRGQTPWRRRGPRASLSESEVLTMEVVGEFLGYDTDEGIYEYFLWHWLSLFPELSRAGRSGFVRQASRLAKVKQGLWRHLLLRLPHDPQLSIVDSFPLYVCQFARAKRCRRFFDEAALAPANVSDVAMAPEVLEGTTGWTLGDRNCWSLKLHTHLKTQGLALLSPPKHRSMDDQFPWSKWLTQKRQRIETVTGQLVGRYHAKRTWARDLWQLLSRIFRKVLSHTVAVFISSQHEG